MSLIHLFLSFFSVIAYKTISKNVLNLKFILNLGENNSMIFENLKKIGGKENEKKKKEKRK